MNPNRPNHGPQNLPVDPSNDPAADPRNRPAMIPRVPHVEQNNVPWPPAQSPAQRDSPQYAPPAQYEPPAQYPLTDYGAAQYEPTTQQPYPSYYPADQPSYPKQESMPPRKGIGRTLLQMFGWTLLFAAVLIALIVGSGLWTARTVTRDLVNPNTRTTVVTKGPVVASIRQVNKQIMVEHNNMVYIDYREAPEGWLQLLPIEQSFVVLLRGQVPAGFELNTLQEEDIWISKDGSKVRLTLPAPAIFEENVSVDFSKSRIIAEGDSCPDFICATDFDALQESVMPQAGPMLIEASRESGIIEQTAQLGIAYYESLLRALGFEEVQVIIRSE